MSYTVVINGTPITLPSSGQSPNWSEGLIEFTQAVESALSGLVGGSDVAPQVMTIDSYNPGTNISITNLTFSTSAVRGVFIKYSVQRDTSSANAYESGTLTGIYNPNNSVGNKWEVARQYVGEGSIAFNITDTGSVQFTTSTLAGTSHVGKLSYSAAALLQS